MNILCTIPKGVLFEQLFSDLDLERLNEIGDVTWNNTSKQFSKEDLIYNIKDKDILITGWGSEKIDKDILIHANKLKFIGHTAGSIKFLVEKEFFENDIIITNANNALAPAIAEYCLAMSLTHSLDLFGVINDMNNGIWRTNLDISDGLNGKTIGLVGYGIITKEFIKLLKMFDVEIFVFSNYCDAKEANDFGFKLCDLKEVLTKDIVSLHNTLNCKTINMIGEGELSLIKDGALFINTARAGIVEEQALNNELQKRRFKAVLDVFHTEPLPMNSQLRTLDNVIITPHSAGTNRYFRKRQGETVINDILNFINGRSVDNQITLEQYLRMTIK